MIKSLEALERIQKTLLRYNLSTNGDLTIIEKALKRLEELEIMYSNCVIEGTKQKKAIEIIKAKLSPLAKATFLPMSDEEFKLIEEVFYDN